MRRLLALSLVTFCLMAVGCGQDSIATDVKLLNVSEDTFDFNGGMACIEVDAGGAAVTADSDSDWCRVMSKGSTVNVNVLSYTGKSDRKAVVTVSSAGLNPLKIEFRQSAFSGLIVTPSTLIFEDGDQPKTVAVYASSDYSVEFTENPDGQFSLEKVATGVVFTSVKGASKTEVKGRAVISCQGAEDVIITLVQSAKSQYEYLLGTWKVTKNTTNLPMVSSDFRFERRETGATFNVFVEEPNITTIPFLAKFVDGEVVIETGQKMGMTADGRYVTLHYNGPSSSGGMLIFTSAGSVAWSAKPLFDPENGKVTLVFSDNGQGKQNVATVMSIYGSKTGYFNFSTGGHIATYMTLELSKTYSE